MVERSLEVLEVLLHEGWVVGKFNPEFRPLAAITDSNSGAVRDNTDIAAAPTPQPRVTA
jgi:hypothetical protein